jgi:gas vesicle protein
MGFKRLVDLKEKVKFKKAEDQPAENSKGKNAAHPKAPATTSKDTGESDLTEKLKAAFHEAPKEDPELQRRKELEQSMRGFRRSFREDVATGVKQQVGGVVTEVKHQVDGVVTEVKHSIANIKEANKARKKERDEEEPLGEP